MPKAANKYAFDLFEEGADCVGDIIFGYKEWITICDAGTYSDEDPQSELKKYRRIVQLLREVNKDLRDKGQNDLYIGYPFVIGRLSGENFDIRAPLALFPVKADRTSTGIRVALDETRDPLYNNTLVLANFKFNNILNPLPANVIENVAEEGFIERTLKFYADNDIIISNYQEDLCKFKEYRAGEFPHFNVGELLLESCAVLGKFPVRDSSIQKDFDEILETNQINTLLNDLLLDINDIDYYSDSYAGEMPITINDQPLEISEKNLLYINDLNSSQETVLSAIGILDELVVQGPPGTGKSQTITSLISELASEGKTVMMVSEKKTALDVVYSRLGNLSKYALLIDDTESKDAFYRQISDMMSYRRWDAQSPDNLASISSSVDKTIRRLEKIADKLYKPNEIGIEPYKLYIKTPRIDLANDWQRNRILNIRQVRDPQLLHLEYQKLSQAHSLFANSSTTGSLDRFYSIRNDYPWLEDIVASLNDLDLLELETELRELEESVRQWKSNNFIIRFFTKRTEKEKMRPVLDKYFSGPDNNHIQLIFDKTDEVLRSLSEYKTYHEYKPLYNKLDDDERMYFSSLRDITPYCDNSLNKSNEELFNEVLFEHITRFEADNRELFADISDFDSIIHSMSEAINKKKKLTRQYLECLLAEDMRNISNSKRQGEIRRALEMKRKWSVNKFLKKFDFEIFKNIKIWLMTPEVVSEIIPLQTGIFDLVVFDEASQMYVEKGIPSILRAKKVVIAGDQKQLRPSSLGAGRIEWDNDDLPEDAEVSAALDEESLLDLARFKYQDVLLNFHYRSKYEELIAFSNHAFYKGRLYVSPNIETPKEPPIQVHKMENALWSNRTNYAEAKYIVEMLNDFFNYRTGNETIGIITFNVSQRDLIDDLIDEKCAVDPRFAASVRTELNRKQDGEDIGLFVKNIESVQGDERMFSCDSHGKR